MTKLIIRKCNLFTIILNGDVFIFINHDSVMWKTEAKLSWLHSL